MVVRASVGKHGVEVYWFHGKVPTESGTQMHSPFVRVKIESGLFNDT